MENREERQIISRCLAGDLDAYAVLVRAYQSPLISLAWNLVGNGEDARDIAQEAFIAAFTHLSDYDPSRSFRTWLFSIGYKRCLDCLRKRRSFLSFFRHRTQAREDFYAAASPASKIEDSRLFSRLLGRLGKKELTALVLRINEEQSYREIAHVLGCSENTARTHFLNAKRKLKRQLARMKSALPQSVFYKETP